MILCCGEALIDMIPVEAEGATAFAPLAGGAVFNTAIALGRLGQPVGFLSGISTDLLGEILGTQLRKSNVSTKYLLESDRPTTLAFVKLDNGQARYSFYDENTAGRMILAADLPEIGRDVEAMFFGGISLIGEPCGSTYEALLNREHGERLIMLDPNVRPGFIREEALYRGRIRRMCAMSDILKLSDEDLHWLEGDGQIDAMAASLLTQGPKIVVITRGADGACAYTAHDKINVAGRKVDVIDTVGAGDTFNAGFLAGLKEHDLLTKRCVQRAGRDAIAYALKLGVAAASVTVSRKGANPPLTREISLD
ncbi:carbohydrate kinase family protein [Limoniibacter endophyticus]|uniref:Fructokinase n=1 Tax=Limoniibacter endophyticus TaxID=1565040 RepID=A0A8J3DII6_9HYPH|nr:carbohydrate kinase [Limoniibacter endophyticus]GHC70573.1 fructokinase [Limoniibacter endophyticus]